MNGEFSRRGEVPTAFERALVAAGLEGEDGMAVWLRVIERAGLDAMLVLFDEVGSEKVHVPTREHFFAALWRVRRDEEIRRRLRAGEGAAELAADFGLSRASVYNIRDHAGGKDAGLQRGVVKGRR